MSPDCRHIFTNYKFQKFRLRKKNVTLERKVTFMQFQKNKDKTSVNILPVCNQTRINMFFLIYWKININNECDVKSILYFWSRKVTIYYIYTNICKRIYLKLRNYVQDKPIWIGWMTCVWQVLYPHSLCRNAIIERTSKP
jgi:hypothetical protein